MVGGVGARQVMLLKAVQKPKQLDSTVFIEEGRVMLGSLSQAQKPLYPIDVTEEGMETLINTITFERSKIRCTVS